MCIFLQELSLPFKKYLTQLKKVVGVKQSGAILAVSCTVNESPLRFATYGLACADNIDLHSSIFMLLLLPAVTSIHTHEQKAAIRGHVVMLKSIRSSIVYR